MRVQLGPNGILMHLKPVLCPALQTSMHNWHYHSTGCSSKLFAHHNSQSRLPDNFMIFTPKCECMLKSHELDYQRIPWIQLLNASTLEHERCPFSVALSYSICNTHHCWPSIPQSAMPSQTQLRTGNDDLGWLYMNSYVHWAKHEACLWVVRQATDKTLTTLITFSFVQATKWSDMLERWSEIRTFQTNHICWK